MGRERSEFGDWPRVRFVKDADGRRVGDVVRVSPARAAFLVRSGVAKWADFRSLVVTKG
jgi:hypothetical protein